jgi:hypothetical protein
VGAWDVLVTADRLLKVLHNGLVLVWDDIVREKQVVKQLIANLGLAMTSEVFLIDIGVPGGVYPQESTFAKVLL